MWVMNKSGLMLCLARQMHPPPAAEFFGLPDLAPASDSSRSAECLEGFRVVLPPAPASACVPQPTALGMASIPPDSPECSARDVESPADSAGSACAFCMGPPEEVFNLPPNAGEEAKPHTRAWHWENALISLRSSWDSSWDSCCPTRPGNRAHKGQQLAGLPAGMSGM